MISKEKLVEDREQENLEYTEKLCKGEVRRAFFAEKTNSIVEDWFEDIKADIEADHDAARKKPVPYYKMQYGSAFALQRDVNTRYSQRVFLMRYGLDQKYDTHAAPAIIAGDFKYQTKDVYEETPEFNSEDAKLIL